MKKLDVKTTEFNSYYQRYIDKLSNSTELRSTLVSGKHKVMTFFKTIPSDKLSYKYDKDKWTVKEVFQHIIDTERIFIYRCLRIARKDNTPLSGFDQNIYIEPSGANQKLIEDLLNEYETTRNNSIAIVNSLTDEDLCFIGKASGNNLSARAAAFIILGHDSWHIDVLKDNYL